MESLRKKLEAQQQKYPSLQNVGFTIEKQAPLYTPKQLNAFVQNDSMKPQYDASKTEKFASGILQYTQAPRTSMPNLQGGNKQTQKSHLFPHVGGGGEEKDNLVNVHKQVNTVFMKSVETDAMHKRSNTYMAIRASEFQSNRPNIIRYDINPSKGNSYSIEFSNLNSAFKK